MKFPRTILLFSIILITSLTALAQDLPPGFVFQKDAGLVFQVEPDKSVFLKDAIKEGSYQGLGLAIGMIENQYALVLVNAVPEKVDYVFEKKKKQPPVITVDGQTVAVSEQKGPYKQKVDDAKFEIFAVAISMEDFERVLAAKKVYVEFGKFNYLATPENLQAFYHLSAMLEKEEQLRDTAASASTPSPGDIRVKGYYRKDGTYVRPHTRKRPSH